MKAKIKYLILGFILCMIVMHISSIIKCEILTHQHYNEFKDAYIQNTMLGDMEFFKVLEYETCDFARVYYVSENYSAGNVLTLACNDGNWEEVSWNSAWSTSGNADKTIYPYWWHRIYFMFSPDRT